MKIQQEKFKTISDQNQIKKQFERYEKSENVHEESNNLIHWPKIDSNANNQSPNKFLQEDEK